MTASTTADIQAVLDEANEAVDLTFHDIRDEITSSLFIARETSAASLEQRLQIFSRQLEVAKRVLLVDSEPDEVRLLTDFFANHNITLDQACTARDALERLVSCDYALVLLDKEHPDTDTLKLLRRIKEDHPATEVMMIVHADRIPAVDALDDRAYDYIPRPFPSLPLVGHRVEGALVRHELEMRVRARFGFMKVEYKTLVKELEEGERERWISKLEEVIDASLEPSAQNRLFVQGAEPLGSLVERMGYQALRAASPEEMFARIAEDGAAGVVLCEDRGDGELAQTVRVLHAIDPDLAIFVLARDADLEKIADALGPSLGDCLVCAIEDRDLFPPRLRRLLDRRDRITYNRKLIEEFKRLIVDLRCAKAGIA